MLNWFLVDSKNDIHGVFSRNIASIPSTSSALTDFPELWLRKLAALSMSKSGDDMEDAVFDAVEYCLGIRCGWCLDSGLGV